MPFYWQTFKIILQVAIRRGPIGIAPSSSDRTIAGSIIIKNMYQRLRVTATHLCRIFLAPHLNFNICFQYSLVSTSTQRQRQVSYGVSSKRLHIFHTSCTHWFMKLSRFNDSIICPLDKIKSELISSKSTQAHFRLL